MKLSGIFILALLSLSVLGSMHMAENSTITRSGSTQDDFHEDTDVIRTRNTSTKVTVDNEKSHQLNGTETLIDEREEDDLNPPVPKVVTETIPVTNPDGTITLTTVTRTILVRESKKIKRVRSLRNRTTIRESLGPFADAEAADLTDNELKLFNAIATTDANRFYSQYNYVELKTTSLRAQLESVVSVFHAALGGPELDSMYASILAGCQQKAAFYHVLDTSAFETHTATAWTVWAEVLMVACSKDGKSVQLLAWSSNKSGGWHKGTYSHPNDETVDRLVTRWLFKNLVKMFFCPSAPPKPCQTKFQMDAHGEVVGKTFHDDGGAEKSHAHIHTRRRR